MEHFKTAEQFEISIMYDTNEVDHLRRMLEPFNAARRPDSRAQVVGIPWADTWAELLKIALYKIGADVSEIGAPLVSDMLSMNVLRPFSAREVVALGGEGAFHPAAWKSAPRKDEETIWAIPWLADPYPIVYWRDMLERAGVDEQTAFQSFDRMRETLERLQANGVASPWVTMTGDRLAMLHTSASWVWGVDGDFVSADGKRLMFHLPEARAGLKAYFSLYRYMPAQDQPVSRATELFARRQVAAWMTSLRFLWTIAPPDAPADVHARIGVALPPGPPLVGGSNLVIWQHSRHEQAALELVRFLVSSSAQKEYCQHIGVLPVRLDVLDQPPYSTNLHLQGYVRAMQHGRPFPTIRMAGMLEDRLATALGQISADVIARPDNDLDTLISSRLEPLARRLETALTASG
jgi:multiple sugar transport system substrate-binding protein